jgi:hypothetical protein
MTSEIEETAKAAQEIAKTAGKAIEAGEKFGGFISKYIGGPLEQGIGIFEDKLKYMRWERQVRLIERAQGLLHERGYNYPVIPVPPKLAIPILQSASLEENDELQDKWAYMLVNATDPNCKARIDVKFAKILDELSLYDVRILDIICKSVTGFGDGVTTIHLPEKVLPLDAHISENEGPSYEVQVSLENLVRLGLLRNETFAYQLLRVRVMALGWELYKACER